MADTIEGKVKTNRLTTSGIAIQSGVIKNDEYVPELKGREKILTYDKMLRSNGTIQEIIDVTTKPITGATWNVEPYSEDDKHKEHAAFVEYNLFENLNMTWTNFLESVMEMLPYGFSVFEKVFKDLPYKGKTMLGIDLFYIFQRSVWYWEKQIGKEKVRGIDQVTDDGHRGFLPMEDALLFTFRQRGDDYEGRSILRAAYLHWYHVNEFYRFAAIGQERQSVGIPVGTYPKNARDEDKARLEAILTNIRTNEMAYMSKPEGYTVEILDMKGGTTKEPMALIEHHISQIAHAALVSFMYLGSSATGSRATSEDHSSIFEKAMEAIAQQIADIINKQVVQKLIELNFAGVTEFPTLKFSGIRRDDITQMSEVLTSLASQGLITPDTETEGYLRKRIGLPEKPLDETGQPVAPIADKNTAAAEKKNINRIHQLIEDRNVSVERVPGETLDQCVERAMPKMLEEGMDQEQAIAVAYSMCKMKSDSQLISDVPIDTMQPTVEALTGQDWARPLTGSEKKVPFKKIEDQMNDTESDIVKRLGELSTQQQSAMMAAVEMALSSDDPLGEMQKIEPIFVDKYGQNLQDELRGLFEYAKNSTANEMERVLGKGKVDTPPTSTDEIDKLKFRAVSIATEHADRLKQDTIKMAGELFLADRAAEEIIPLVKADVQAKAEKRIKDTAVVSAPMSYNQGRSYLQQQNDSEIYGYQYSAILDYKTCTTCLALDQKVVNTKDAAYFQLQPPQHFYCRCIWVEILKEETDKPPITGVPPEVGRDYTVGNFKQLDTQTAKDISSQDALDQLTQPDES